MTNASDDAVVRRWRGLVAYRLPQAARTEPDWPVQEDHCFARILLDHACGGPWRDSVAAPAWANMPPERLLAAITLGEAVLAGRADLAALNQTSLAWRRKQTVWPNVLQTNAGKRYSGVNGDTRPSPSCARRTT